MGITEPVLACPHAVGQHVEEKSGKCLTSETFVSVKNSIVMETFSKSIFT